MLNKPLFEEYIQWLKQTSQYSKIEALFFQLFLEYQDVWNLKRDKRQKKTLRIIKLKELIAITLVKGEYHEIIHYLLLNKDNIKAPKEIFETEKSVEESKKNFDRCVSNFKFYYLVIVINL